MNSTTSGGPSTTSGRSVPNTGPSIVVAAFTTWSIAVVFVLLRLYTRAFIIRAVGPADYCITAAVVSVSRTIYTASFTDLGGRFLPAAYPELFSSVSNG